MAKMARKSAVIEANDSFVRLKAVEGQVGFKSTKLYKMMAAGDFPRPYRTGLRAVAWRQSEVTAWMASRPRADATDHHMDPKGRAERAARASVARRKTPRSARA